MVSINLEGMCKHHLNARLKSKKAMPLNEEEITCLWKCNGYHNQEHNGCKFKTSDEITKTEYQKLIKAY